MLLKLSEGKSVCDAYKEYYISTLIASRKWRRDLINHWTTKGGSPLKTINGKVYWGGRFYFDNIAITPDRTKMAQYFGIDQEGIDDIQSTYRNDAVDHVYAIFNPKPKTTNPYAIDNVAFVFEHGIAPKAASITALQTITFKSINVTVPAVYTNGVLDDPMLHAPAALVMKSALKTDASFHPNFSINNTLNVGDTVIKNAFGESGFGHLFSSIYSVSDFLEQFCSHTVSVNLVKTNYNLLETAVVSWEFQTYDVFVMGDYSWITDNNVRDFLFPMISIGASTKEDYFTFTTTFTGFRGNTQLSGFAKNLSGHIMEVIESTVTGNTLLALQNLNVSPYEWAIVDDDRLWFEYDYIMNMEIKEFMQVIVRHLDIEIKEDDGGFFGTFVGGFIGGLLEFVGDALNLFFKIVELTDVFMKPMILAHLWVFEQLGIISHNDGKNIMKVYRVVRNHVVLAVLTMGIGEYMEAANASAIAVEGGGVALSGAEILQLSFDLFAYDLGSMLTSDIVSQAIKLAGAVYNDLTAVDAASTAKQTAESVEDAIKNPMGVVYESDEIDFIDAMYMMMDDLGMGVSKDDPLEAVYW